MMNLEELTSIKTGSNDALEVSEKFYEELYSKADILYFVLDESFKIVTGNIVTEEILGYERSKIAGKNFPDLVIEGQRDSIKKDLKICAERGYLKDREYKLQGFNNNKIAVLINGLTVKDKNGTTKIRLFIKDITLQYKLKKQRDIVLFTSSASHYLAGKEFNKEIIEKLQKSLICSGVQFFSRKSDDSYVIIERWDPSLSLSIATDTFRKVGTEEIDKFIQEFQTSIVCERTKYGSVWIENIDDFIEENGQDLDQRIQNFIRNFKSVSITPVLVKGIEKGYILAYNTIEEAFDEDEIVFIESISSGLVKKPGGAEVSYSENKFNNSDLLSVFHVPYIGICMLEDGKIIKANKWMCSFLNANEGSLEGRNLIEFIDDEFHPTIKQISASATTGEFVSVDDLIVITDNGEQKKVKVTATQLSANGTVKELWYFVSREEHERIQRTLLQARKMESLGMLAGGIIHDFNNQLACILGFSSMLSEEISTDNPYYDDIRQITVTAEKATELTSRLMAHTQGTSYIVDDLDVNQLVKEVAGILSRTLEKSISIRAQMSPELDKIKGDASKIQQAILQVALNARDAMTDGGKIIFKTRNLFLGQDNPWLKYGGKPGKYIQIEITDTGRGMSKDIKEKLLKSPSSDRSKESDKGMGISMVKEILEEHGGFLSIFSQQQKGTVVKIHLPVKKSEKTNNPAFDGGEELILGKETVLLVDGEKVFRETARKMLTRYGYKVISAESKAEALAIYKKYINRIDLIIMDMFMPGMEIEKIINVIKKMNRKIKIITTSETAKEALDNSRIKEFISGYVQKPFQVRPLLTEVRSVLNA